MKKYSRLSSAAVVIGTLRVKRLPGIVYTLITSINSLLEDAVSTTFCLLQIVSLHNMLYEIQNLYHLDKSKMNKIYSDCLFQHFIFCFSGIK